MRHTRWFKTLPLVDTLVRAAKVDDAIRARLITIAAQIHLYHTRDLAVVQGLLDRALKLAPTDGHALSTLGDYWVERGDVSQAEAQFARAVTLAPSNANG